MRKKEKIMLSIIIGIALIAIVIIIAPVQDIIGQAMKAMSVQSSQQQTAANSNTYNAHNIITTAECNDHEDNEGDSFIDLGGCYCYGDRKI